METPRPQMVLPYDLLLVLPYLKSLATRIKCYGIYRASYERPKYHNQKSRLSKTKPSTTSCYQLELPIVRNEGLQIRQHSHLPYPPVAPIEHDQEDSLPLRRNSRYSWDGVTCPTPHPVLLERRDLFLVTAHSRIARSS